jgi:DNA invertase Pin-like site-specific DNA recombinase
MEGIAKAKAAGVYKGRKPKINRGAIEKVMGEGLGATAIAQKLGISRASVYRITGSVGA